MSTKVFPLTMPAAKVGAIFSTFMATTDSDRATRDGAERTIQQQYQTDSTFVYHLFEFIVLEPAVIGGAYAEANSVQLVQTAQLLVAINFRNFVLGRTFHNEYENQVVHNPTTGASEQKIIVTGSTRMAADWRNNDLILPDVRIAIRND
eukprot:PhF_6_TR24653/c0_g1_i1/m.33901